MFEGGPGYLVMLWVVAATFTTRFARPASASVGIAAIVFFVMERRRTGCRVLTRILSVTFGSQKCIHLIFCVDIQTVIQRKEAVFEIFVSFIFSQLRH